jgi:hypothetical protein
MGFKKIMGMPEFISSKIYIADIGAAGGLQERWDIFGENLIAIGFEPDKREFHKLPKSEKFRWFNTALHANSAEHDLFITRWQTNTSLLKPNQKIIEGLFYPRKDDFDVIKTIKVHVSG